MRSTYFADKETREAIPLIDDPAAEEMDSRGFLGFAVVFFVIYALASRPILYAELGKWLTQILKLGFRAG